MNKQMTTGSIAEVIFHSRMSRAAINESLGGAQVARLLLREALPLRPHVHLVLRHARPLLRRQHLRRGRRGLRGRVPHVVDRMEKAVVANAKKGGLQARRFMSCGLFGVF